MSDQGVLSKLSANPQPITLDGLERRFESEFSGLEPAFVSAKAEGGLRKSLSSPNSLTVLLQLAVCAICVLAVSLAWVIANGGHPTLLVVAAAMSMLCMLLRGDMRPRMVPDLTAVIPHVAVSVAMGTGLALVVDVFFDNEPASAAVLLAQFVTLNAGALSGVIVGMFIVRFLRRSNRLRSRALVIGNSDLALEYAIEIDHRQSYGVDVVGLVGGGSVNAHGGIAGTLAGLPELIATTNADRLIVMPTGESSELIGALRWAAMQPGLQVFVVPRFYDLGMGSDSVSPDRVRGYPLVHLHRTTSRQLGLLGKRVFDASAAGLGLLVLSPLFLVVAAAVKATSPREQVFFRQERVGQGGQSIEILKFRSMTTSATSDEQWVGEAEARVTRLGSFLRKSSIDEIPQLISILKGEMSIVGPRPERPHFAKQFSREIPGYSSRHRMPVGLTGLSQIVGLRGDTSIAERAKIDNIYIDQWRFRWDLEIIVKTAWAIVRSSRYAEDAVAVEERLRARSDPSLD